LSAKPLESVTVKPKVEDPLDKGVPVMAPDDPNVSPGGNEKPGLSVQVYGGTPPEIPVTVWSEAE
jgi:hypothetical protein